jgi:glycosyltransferase involved in cell wall biosynthesis
LYILDDGSTDKSLDFAKRFNDSRIHVVSDGCNLKVPARLNQGVQLSRGKYLARMDADDISYPNRLETQVNFLERHPTVDIVASRVIIFESSGRIVGTYPFKEQHSEICSRPEAGFYFPHPTWTGKLSWFRSHPYALNTNKAEDQVLLLRTYQTSHFACLPVFLLGYRKDELPIGTIATGRYVYSKMLLRKAFAEKDMSFVFGPLEQAAKLVFETIAIMTGLKYRMLKHRAIPVSQLEADQWKKVWEICM